MAINGTIMSPNDLTNSTIWFAWNSSYGGFSSQAAAATAFHKFLQGVRLPLPKYCQLLSAPSMLMPADLAPEGPCQEVYALEHAILKWHLSPAALHVFLLSNERLAPKV